MKTVEWDGERQQVRMIDQRCLPVKFKTVSYKDHHQVAKAIRDMVIRGAPAIGIAAAFGLALAAIHSNAKDLPSLRSNLEDASRILREARPTAANISWAVSRILKLAGQHEGDINSVKVEILDEAQRMADEDIQINQRMARWGAKLIDDGDTIIHHCNTGALATVDWGTALGVIRTAHEMGKKIHVLVDETRPRLQGSRLTAWELEQYGIPYEIICDSAAGYFLHNGQVDKVLFGGDRIAANGDLANKIGTYMLALTAHANNVPVYPVVPTSSIDLSLEHGDLIPIEERDPAEVLNIKVDGQPVVPSKARARNPAFDVTPHDLLTAIVTENGVVYPPFINNLPSVVNGNKP